MSSQGRSISPLLCFFICGIYFIFLDFPLAHGRLVTPANEGIGFGLDLAKELFLKELSHRNRYPYVDHRSLPENGLYFNHSAVPPEYTPGTWNRVPLSRAKISEFGSFEEWLQSLRDESKFSGDFQGVQTNDRGRLLNVFLPDQRVVLDDLDIMDMFPYRTSGALLLQALDEVSFVCSATIISEWLVLTNAHCIPSPGDWRWEFYFMNIGYTLAESNYKIRFGRYIAGSSMLDDFAILEMIEPIGRYTGWVGLDFQPLSYFEQDRKLSMISYSGDILEVYDAPGVSFDCSSRGIFDGHVRHDCDATKGSSGSSILGTSWYNCNETQCFSESLCVCNNTGVGPFALGINTWEVRDSQDGPSLILDEFSVNVSNGFIPTIRVEEAYTIMSNLDPPRRCGSITGCLECLSTVECGWCESSQSCMPGRSVAPLEPLQCSSWVWFRDNCSAPTILPTYAPTLSIEPTEAPVATSRPTIGNVSTEVPTVSPTEDSNATFSPTQPTSDNASTEVPTVSPTEDSNFTIPPASGVNFTLSPTSAPSFSSCDTFTCPPNSERKRRVKCVRSHKDCSCDSGYRYRKKSRSCEFCSTFECPANSLPHPRSKCIRRSKDCRCVKGYRKREGLCTFCNFYTCPAKSRPHPRRQCVTRFRHCLCLPGYKRKAGECQPCDRFQCPENSKRRKVCVKNFRHCSCLEGYEKEDGVCVKRS